MTNTELMTYRRQLLALQSRLNTDVSDLADEALGKPGDEATANLSHAPRHLADKATDSFEQQFTLSLMENEEQTLGEIAAALDRIEQGIRDNALETVAIERNDRIRGLYSRTSASVPSPRLAHDVLPSGR